MITPLNSLQEENLSLENTQDRTWLKNQIAQVQDKVINQVNFKERTSVAQQMRQAKTGDRLQDEKRIGNLKDIREQQMVLRQKLRHNRDQQKLAHQMMLKLNKSYDFKVKSNKQLRQLTKKYRKFKENLLQKSRIIYQEEQKQKELAKKLKEEQMISKCKQKRQRIKQTLQRMDKRRAERRQEHKRQKDLLKKLRKKKLYQKVIEDFNQRQIQQMEAKLKNYRNEKREVNLSISSLSLHQLRYEQTKQEMMQKRTLRMTESRVLPELNYYKSKFYDSVVEQDKREKQRKEVEGKRGQQVCSKHKEYQSRILQQFRPQEKAKIVEQKESQKRKAMDWEQLKKAGNQLYKKGQKRVKSLQKRKIEQSEKEVERKVDKKKYPDYLSSLPKKARKMDKFSIFSSELQKLKFSIKNKQTLHGDRVQHIQDFLTKLEDTEKSKTIDGQQEASKIIQAKFQLYEILSNLQL